VRSLADVAGDAQLRRFADNPKVTSAQVFDVITSALRAPVGERARNLLATVIDNGRIAVLPEIAAQFRALVNARSGVSDALIESAFPIDAGALAEVVAMLEKRFARRLAASVVVKPELIGGIRVSVGDEVLDTSVAARLEQMKVALAA
jgi:F-type H+-transporting ATPase subunit delta